MIWVGFVISGVGFIVLLVAAWPQDETLREHPASYHRKFAGRLQRQIVALGVVVVGNAVALAALPISWPAGGDGISIFLALTVMAWLFILRNRQLALSARWKSRVVAEHPAPAEIRLVLESQRQITLPSVHRRRTPVLVAAGDQAS